MKKLYFVIPCSIALVLFVITRFLSQGPTRASRLESAPDAGFAFSPAHDRSSSSRNAPPRPALPVSGASRGDSKPAAVQSLQAMTSTLSQFAKPNQKIEDLLETLSSQHMQPYLSRTENPYTGEMTMARTQNPLPGTRYFYAQYAGSGQDRVLQRMSFEFEPGASAMGDATAAVQQSFQTSLPVRETEDFKQWDAGNGYVVWIKKLQADDMKNHPFNAYDSEDVGTVLVAVEISQDEAE